jgi:hypothetical protein
LQEICTPSSWAVARNSYFLKSFVLHT